MEESPVVERPGDDEGGVGGIQLPLRFGHVIQSNQKAEIGGDRQVEGVEMETSHAGQENMTMRCYSSDK